MITMGKASAQTQAITTHRTRIFNNWKITTAAARYQWTKIKLKSKMKVKRRMMIRLKYKSQTNNKIYETFKFHLANNSKYLK